MKKRFLALLLGGLLLLTAVGCSGNNEEEKAVAKTTVSVATAVRGPMSRGKRFEGALEPKSEVAVAVATPGKVLSSQVDVGSKVEKGELLFTMDSKDVAVQRKTGEAQYGAAKKASDFANSTIAQMEGQQKQLSAARDQMAGQLPDISAVLAGLVPQIVSQQEANDLMDLINQGRYADANTMLDAIIIRAAADGSLGNLVTALQSYGSILNNISQMDQAISTISGSLATAKGQVISAEGQKDIAAAALAVVDAQIRNFKVYAPISGTIGSYDVTVGGYPSQQPLSIVDLSKMHLTLYLVDSEIMLVHQGDTLEVTLDALPDQTLTGTVLTVSPTIDPSSKTYPVVVEIDNPEEKFKPGFFAKADLVFERISDTIYIPASAVGEGGDAPYVYVLEDGRAKKKTVKTGMSDTKNNIQILQGVAEGDRVITSNLSALQDGMEVNVARSAGTNTDLGEKE